jgi:hypothetical protein
MNFSKIVLLLLFRKSLLQSTFEDIFTSVPFGFRIYKIMIIGMATRKNSGQILLNAIILPFTLVIHISYV